MGREGRKTRGDPTQGGDNAIYGGTRESRSVRIDRKKSWIGTEPIALICKLTFGEAVISSLFPVG